MSKNIGVALMVLLGAGSVSAETSLADRMLIDFDHNFQTNQFSIDEGDARILNESGNRVLELRADAGERVKIRLRPAGEKWDLKAFVNMAMDFENRSEGEAWLRILIKDSTTGKESWYRPNLSHNAWIRPGETRKFPALLVRHKYKNKAVRPDYMDLFPKMHGLPHAQMLVWFGVDVTQITEVVISLEPKEHAQTVRIDNVRGNRRASPVLLETDPDSFFPFIDVYGQYMHEDWPGKIYSDDDLIKARKTEERDLQLHPRSKSFNRFGGWADGPTLKATGHFRTEKVDGKWWFVDPEGKLFWSLGCTGVGLQDMKLDLSVKRHFYDGLPDKDDPVFGRFYAKGGNDYKSMSTVLHKKFGADFESTYNHWALRRAQSWSLNTLGGWSAASVNQPEGLRTPYTWVLWVGGKRLKPFHKINDPFAPDFEQGLIKALNHHKAMIDDPYCIGFFCNNEIHWGKDPVELVRQILNENSDEVYAKKELLRFIEEAGNQDDATLLSYYRHLLDTYYRKCRDAIKSVAPDKLYLGSRIHDGAFRKEVPSAAAKYCDVVSFNSYEKDLNQFNVRDERDLPFFPEDKPFIIGEFDFGALDRGKFFTGIGFAADQRNRGEAYIHYIHSGLRNPRCVGAHWFHYVDSATGARYQDAENANAGLIDSTDTPYPELIKTIRAVGSEMYSARFFW